MNTKILWVTMVAAVGLAGCEIEQTEEGEMPDIDVDAQAGQLPEYDVDVTQTQEGKLPDVDVDVDAGKLPEYKLTGPEVTIGTQEKTVEVPTGVDIETEEKTFTVPDVDIDLPEDKDDKE